MINYKVLGINSKCATDGMSYEERCRLFRDVGFGSLLLWGGEEETPLEKRVDAAEKAGLYIESIHAPYVGNTYIWMDDVKGEAYLQKQIELARLVKTLGVKTLVIHPEGNEGIPTVNERGKARYKRLFDEIERLGINLAIENIHKADTLKSLLLGEDLPHVGFCCDSGHYNIWSDNCDMLALFGNKLKAIHLHDNDGKTDTHDPLFEGCVNFEDLAKRLVKTSYSGTLTLETKFHGNTYKELEERVEKAYASGKRFARLLEDEYAKLNALR